MIKKLLREALAFGARIDEIDWEDTFSDVSTSTLESEKNNINSELSSENDFIID